jgi:hypothetical protein
MAVVVDLPMALHHGAELVVLAELLLELMMAAQTVALEVAQELSQQPALIAIPVAVARLVILVLVALVALQLLHLPVMEPQEVVAVEVVVAVVVTQQIQAMVTVVVVAVLGFLVRVQMVLLDLVELALIQLTPAHRAVVVLVAETGLTGSLIMVITLTALCHLPQVVAGAVAVAETLIALVAMVVFASFGRGQAVLSPQQTQAMYKEKTWNFLFAFKTVSLLSIQFLVTISDKHFLM